MFGGAPSGLDRLTHGADSTPSDDGHEPIPDLLPLEHLDGSAFGHRIRGCDRGGEAVDLDKAESSCVIHRALS